MAGPLCRIWVEVLWGCLMALYVVLLILVCIVGILVDLAEALYPFLVAAGSILADLPEISWALSFPSLA